MSQVVYLFIGWRFGSVWVIHHAQMLAFYTEGDMGQYHLYDKTDQTML